MTIENSSMEKCWDYFNPPKPEEQIPGKYCLHLHFKISPYFQKTKKTTQKLFV